MPEVEADTDIVKVRGVNHLHQFLWRGKFVRNIFQQNAHPERLGKRTQCSIEVIAASNFFSLKLSLGNPRCCTRKRNGICSAISRARFTSSVASTSPARSVDARFMGAAPVRPHS